MKALLIQANAAQIPIADESVHCVVTSPPYFGLRDYGLPPLIWGGERGCGHRWGEEQTITRDRQHLKELGERLGCLGGNKHSESAEKYDASQGQFCSLCGAWRGCLGLEPTPELYVEHIVAVFCEVRRVLRPDGTVWLVMGDSYTSTAQGTFNAPQIKGSPVNPEQWANYRPFTGLKPKDLVGIPWRVAFALQADGWWLRSDIIWSKPNPMPESVTDRPTKAHEYVFLLSKSARYYWDQEAVREEQTGGTHSRGRGDGGAKARAAEGTNVRSKTSWAESTRSVIVPGGRNIRTVWEIATRPYPGAHYAVFPPQLVEPCIKAGTSARGCCPECGAPWERVVEASGGTIGRSWHNHKNDLVLGQRAEREAKGGHGYKRTTLGWIPACSCPDHEPVPCTVLDPFCGSGTTGRVARKLRRNFIGLDLSLTYLYDQAIKRLRVTPLLPGME